VRTHVSIKPDARTEQETNGRADGCKAANQTAMARIAVLDQKDRRCGKFTADGQALQQAEADEQ
jgi:hypothetical protein